MSTSFVPLLPAEAIARLPDRAREVVEYRKSGLSLNHVQGCSLGCAYCIRHTYRLWDADKPVALMSDAEAVEHLVSHRYFRPHSTPLQIFNRATDPLLARVKEHLFAVLEDLDSQAATPSHGATGRCSTAGHSPPASWDFDDYEAIGRSLGIGHLLECGSMVSGGVVEEVRRPVCCLEQNLDGETAPAAARALAQA